MESFEKPAMNLEKPPVVYHATPNRSIEKFEPRAEHFRDENEGPVIFATPDKAVASMFLVRADDSWSEKGVFNGIPYMVIGDRDRFKTMDIGGTIYELPGDTFQTDAEKGMGLFEWTSTEKVIPTERQHVDSALDTMIGYGVQVYFVDHDTFRKIQESPDHGFAILQGLESENKKRDENVRQFG